METHERARTDLRDSDDVQTKAKTLSAVGITLRTAERYQMLAGPKLEQAARLVDKATEAYFAQQQEAKEPLTLSGLREAGIWGSR
jgi:hypothetical protein